ncbi:Protein STU1 [Leucoagaricus sp. SymC.cos]|nr:Protein STU1 [Leucoagaricus sp. SymC.cos]
MSSGGVLEKLVNQCRSNDVEVKIDALTKMQAQFESGVEIENADIFLNIFKTSLRSSNQHLTTVATSALPPLLPLLITPAHNGVVDSSTLRLVLTSLLPLVMERLGDKDRVQVKARESIALLGGYSFKTGTSALAATRSRDGKGPETPNMLFERLLKELGLASKVWKTREQSILVLVSIRRSHPQFPIRPYLSLLVGCLEDTDAHVRDCSRTSVVELFTGPGVTDAARADLKKEMTKKGVRKTIMDGVLSKLLGASTSSGGSHSRDGSENGKLSENGENSSSKQEYIPPSLMLQGKRPRVPSNSSTAFVPSRNVSYTGSGKESSRPASRADTATPPLPPAPIAAISSNDTSEVQTVYITSSRDLENEFLSMAKSFEGKETEHNWSPREQAILRVRGMLKGDVHQRYPDVFMASLKDGFMQCTLKTLVSLRTTVAVNTCLLYSELAINIGSSLDPFCDLLLTNLLKMAGVTKKMTAQQSQSTITTIITHTSAQPRVIVPLLWSTLQEKTTQTRTFAVGHIKTYLTVHGLRAKSSIEASGNLEVLDKCLRKALGDANPAVRESARKVFWDFDEIWSENGAAILESLDATARKQLDRVCPDLNRQMSIPPTTPRAPKKASIAAAIAASRAKAKAIATAPPTLRHQATAASHNLPSQRRSGSPGSPTSSRTTFARPTSPLRLSSSPPSIRVPAQTMRSTAAALAPTHRRTSSSGGSGRGGSPTPLAEPSAVRRASSNGSATSPGRGTFSRAMQTALPASPPTSPPHTSPTPRASNILARNAPVPLPPRTSALFPQMSQDTDESLLLAQSVPIPLDDESDDDMSANLMSFSAPFQNFRPPVKNPLTPPESQSPKSFDSKPVLSVSNALSSGSIATSSVTDQPVIVEDALKARAEQAESAAERLLELVEPDVEDTPHPSLPPSLLVGNQSAESQPQRLPVTPTTEASHILKQAAMFQDSPAHSGRISLLDMLQEAKQETWWSKRRAGILLRHGRKFSEDLSTSIEACITALSSSSVNSTTFYRVAGLSLQNPVPMSPPTSPGNDPSSPTPFDSSRSVPSLLCDGWENNKNFTRLFKTMMDALTSEKDSDVLETGLIAVAAIIENQLSYLEGKEADIFSMLLRVRYSNKVNVLEATNTIRDMLTVKLEPVYGLTTIHASLKEFHATEPPSAEDIEVKSATYSFGLIALGKFILRLPSEVAEEELPRMKSTLISALNDKSSLIIRESAAASIIAAQLVLRDETHLFALLDGLADDKKNLLTYLFDKHGARGMTASNGTSGLDKLEKEIRRLDTRTSTPSRTS